MFKYFNLNLFQWAAKETFQSLHFASNIYLILVYRIIIL